jgi:hypothetical protein
MLTEDNTATKGAPCHLNMAAKAGKVVFKEVNISLFKYAIFPSGSVAATACFPSLTSMTEDPCTRSSFIDSWMMHLNLINIPFHHPCTTDYCQFSSWAVAKINILYLSAAYALNQRCSGLLPFLLNKMGASLHQTIWLLAFHSRWFT